eukprot:1162116-Pelagomonas_calceolata.AAC.3
MSAMEQWCVCVCVTLRARILKLEACRLLGLVARPDVTNVAAMSLTDKEIAPDQPGYQAYQKCAQNMGSRTKEANAQSIPSEEQAI